MDLHQKSNPNVIMSAATIVITQSIELPTTSTNADKKELDKYKSKLNDVQIINAISQIALVKNYLPVLSLVQ